MGKCAQANKQELVRAVSLGSVRIEENSGNTGTVSLAGASAFPADIASEPNAEGKRILIATPRGYCAGVDRAVDTVEKALELYDPPVYVRKEIVHNKFVVETLMKRGAIFVHDTDEVPEGARVVFSAHGVSPAVQEAANRRMLQTIDATCPLVTKVHKQAVRFADQDYDILLIGHIGHEEVEGTQGEAPDHIQVVNGPEDVANVQVRDPDRVVWISQTTLSVDETMKTVELLRKRFPNLMNPPSDDICYATQNRQGSVKEMAPDCDVVIVVGSANSSNSVRLVEVALEGGARAAYRVDKADELQREWVEGNLTIGVTSGASVPEILVRDVVDQLKEWGFTSVEPVFTVHEDVHFSLPKNLRGELKATGVEVDRPHKARAKGASRRSTARSTGRLASDEDSDSSLA
ncbi:4-hydroxy-3-methylbut-2-enyl diphosphate reductase [Arcanobacterium phocisimile]|uniref:4-hydroxy-3-methylbut-2-enyl diphosphate reductase n=1 Tax=Arcanobacterium phocisimile TaxID=1302235 RepID=A0ABX7IHB3_9ACTO|nr:4-hydroxy-3-methylbut-2-enyl diphosphate reductase [Arcanobacterium phocisimile]